MTAPVATLIESNAFDAKNQDQSRFSPVHRGGWAFKQLVVDLLIECSYESGLLDAINNVRRMPDKQGRGRPFIYSNESLLRAFFLRMLERKRYAKDFVEYLEGKPQAQQICGFIDQRIPVESTISRFSSLLGDLHDIILDTIMMVNRRNTTLVALGRETGGFGDDAPPLGEILAIDSTDIESFSDPSHKRHIDPSCPAPKKPDDCTSRLPNCCKPSDVRAAWGFRTDKNSPKGVSPFFGYKLHTICDAYYGTPLHAILLPANDSDIKQLRRLVEETLKRYPWLAPRYLLADKGYDSTENFVWLDSIGITPIIAVRKPRKKKGSKRATHDVVRKGEFREYESSYTKKGYPLCAGDKAMEYVGSDAERGHLFRCQDGGCALKKKQTLFSMFCSDEQWEKPEGALLRVIGKIPRFSQKWKQLYKLRQTIERFFGSAKRSRLLNKSLYLTMDKVDMHASLSLLSYSATMLARLMGGDYARMRHMRI